MQTLRNVLLLSFSHIATASLRNKVLMAVGLIIMSVSWYLGGFLVMVVVSTISNLVASLVMRRWIKSDSESFLSNAFDDLKRAEQYARGLGVEEKYLICRDASNTL